MIANDKVRTHRPLARPDAMNRGFYTILAAQFFSALADNALLFAAIALLASLHAQAWQTPVLQQFFVFAYIVLAPFVGPFADSLPKGRVMFVTNAVKLLGCVAMLLGTHPLLAYGLVGVGAAMYSPAKYGILTEYLPHQKLVLANGWMEGLTVAAIILGSILGGIMVGDQVRRLCFHARRPAAASTPGIDTPPELAITVILLFYFIAAMINLYIPRVAIDHKLPKRNPVFIMQDFWHSFRLLWRDPLGQVSLAVTTLFWGAGATLRLIVLTWAVDGPEVQPGKGDPADRGRRPRHRRSGRCWRRSYVSLKRAVRVLPVGIAMGLLVVSMVFVTDWRIAIVPADPDRRDGRLFRRADECPAAAPRPLADGRGPLDRRAELQREPLDPGAARRLCADDQGRHSGQTPSSSLSACSSRERWPT